MVSLVNVARTCSNDENLLQRKRILDGIFIASQSQCSKQNAVKKKFFLIGHAWSERNDKGLTQYKFF
jgi:hypothetical protein